jgi:uncharacterized membrane protein
MRTPPNGTSADKAFDELLGHVLRVGTILSGLIVLAGAVVYLARHGSATPQWQVFRGEPTDLSSIRGVVGDVRRGSGRGIIQFGVLALIATPVARVVFSVAQFVRQRDWMYVAITLAVLSLLTYSLLIS